MGFGIALLLLLIIGAMSYRSITQLVADADDEAQSSEVIDALGGLDVALKDAELAEREELAGTAGSAGEYSRATATITQRLTTAREATRDDANMQRQLEEFDAILNRRLVQHRAVTDAPAAQKPAAIAESRLLGDQLDKKLADIDTSERARLAQRRTAADESGASAERVIVIVSVISVIALLIAAYYIA